MDPHRRLLDVARDLIDRFERDGIDYALGGALALGYWSDPRGTLDVDITVFVTLERLEVVVSAMESLGAKIDLTQCLASATDRGMFASSLHGFRIDVFVPDIPLYESARQRRRSVVFQGRPALVWSAEDTVLFKMLYFRSKDRVDVETLMRIQGARLDVGYIREWLHEMVGEDDERTRWFESTLRGVDAPP